ncbi:chromosomal replication initiator protein DnaA [Thomasclavelia sp.]
MRDNSKIWQLCLDTLEKQNLPEERKIDKVIMESVFRSAQIASINNSKVTITTPYSFNIETIKNNIKDIEDILSGMLASPVTVEIIGEDEFKKSITEEKKEIFRDNLNKTLTFDNFVVGSSNRMAQNAALLVSTNPGSNFNPLFIYSNPGLGKTHLLNAIGNYAKEVNPSLKIRYITSKDFVDEVIGAMKGKDGDEIYAKYKMLDILLIDDIQFLFNKEKSSEIFFHIFNEIINNNKQIVITSDKMPEDLQGIESRLISRFNSGLSFGIDPPEFETARAILEKKIDNLDNPSLVIRDDVVDFMANHYCKDIRSLEGALKRLFFCSIMNHTNTIDMAFALESFKDDKIVKNPKSALTKESILKTTAEFYYLTISQLISKNKTRKLTTPREMCMYLMRELLDITFAEIGMTFSNRDHSTVMKACARVETKIKKDSDYKLAINKLKEKLNVN